MYFHYRHLSLVVCILLLSLISVGKTNSCNEYFILDKTTPSIKLRRGARFHPAKPNTATTPISAELRRRVRLTNANADIDIESFQVIYSNKYFEALISDFKAEPTKAAFQNIYSFPYLFIKTGYDIAKIKIALDALSEVLTQEAATHELINPMAWGYRESLLNALFAKHNHIIKNLDLLPIESIEKLINALVDYEYMLIKSKAYMTKHNDYQNDLIFTLTSLVHLFNEKTTAKLARPILTSRKAIYWAHRQNTLPEIFQHTFLELWGTKQRLPTLTVDIPIYIESSKESENTMSCGSCLELSRGHIYSLSQRDNPSNNQEYQDYFQNNTLVTYKGQLLGSIKWKMAGDSSFLALANIKDASGQQKLIAGGVYNTDYALYTYVRANNFPAIIELDTLFSKLHFYPNRFIKSLKLYENDKDFFTEFKGLVLHLRTEALTRLQP